MTNLDKWYRSADAALAGCVSRHPDGYHFAVSPDGQHEVIRFDDGQTAIRDRWEWLKIEPASQFAAVIREGLSQ